MNVFKELKEGMSESLQRFYYLGRAEERAAIIGKVEGMYLEQTKNETNNDWFFGSGYNQALDDLLAHLRGEELCIFHKDKNCCVYDEKIRREAGIQEETECCCGELELDYTRILGQQILWIPKGQYQASRYDTDNIHVLHLWANGKSYDIQLPKDVLTRKKNCSCHKPRTEPTPEEEQEMIDLVSTPRTEQKIDSPSVPSAWVETENPTPHFAGWKDTSTTPQSREQGGEKCDETCPWFSNNGSWGGGREFWEQMEKRHERHLKTNQ